MTYCCYYYYYYYYYCEENGNFLLPLVTLITECSGLQECLGSHCRRFLEQFKQTSLH